MNARAWARHRPAWWSLILLGLAASLWAGGVGQARAETAISQGAGVSLADDEGRPSGRIGFPGPVQVAHFGADRRLWAGLGFISHGTGASSGCNIHLQGRPGAIVRWRAVAATGKRRGWGDALPGTLCSFRPTPDGGFTAVVWFDRGTTVWHWRPGTGLSARRLWRKSVDVGIDALGRLDVHRYDRQGTGSRLRWPGSASSRAWCSTGAPTAGS